MGSSFAIGFVIAATFLVLALRIYVSRKSRDSRPPGSIADLVRRGQLRSDRRGMYDSTPSLMLNSQMFVYCFVLIPRSITMVMLCPFELNSL